MIYHTLKVHYVKWFSAFHKVALAQSRHGGIKQAGVKNGERENSESVSGSKKDFLLTNFAMYRKTWVLGKMENAGWNVDVVVSL